MDPRPAYASREYIHLHKPLALTMGITSLFIVHLLWLVPPVAFVALLMMLMAWRCSSFSRNGSSLLWSMSYVGITTLIAVSLLGLCIYETPCLIGAGIAVMGWIIESYRTQFVELRRTAYLLIHLHAASLPLVFLGGASLTDIFSDPMSLSLGYPWLVLILWGGSGLWMLPQLNRSPSSSDFARSVWFLLSGMGIVAIVACFLRATWFQIDSALVFCAALIHAVCQLESARINKKNEEVVISWVIALSTIPLLVFHGVIPMGTPWSPLVLASVGVGLFGLAWAFDRTCRYRIAVNVTHLFSHGVLLLAVVMSVVCREFAFGPLHTGLNSIALLVVAVFYFTRWIEKNDCGSLLIAAGLSNLSLAFTALECHWSDPQIYMIPIGATILLLVEILRRDIPQRLCVPLRYIGSLVILVSPLWHILDGHWLAYFTLMAASMAVTLLAMGLRVRSLLYIGSAFLLGDLLAILVRGCLDHPDLLWVAGLGLGTMVIILGAVCERKREQIIIRIQGLQEALKQWQ